MERLEGGSSDECLYPDVDAPCGNRNDLLCLSSRRSGKGQSSKLPSSPGTSPGEALFSF